MLSVVLFCISLITSFSPSTELGFPSGFNGKKMQETQESPVRFLGQEDVREEEMATHSRILVWEIPWTEEPGRVTFHGVANTE